MEKNRRQFSLQEEYWVSLFALWLIKVYLVLTLVLCQRLQAKEEEEEEDWQQVRIERPPGVDQ